MAPAGDPAQASAAGIDKPGNAWSVNDGLSGCALRDSTNFDARTLFQPPPAGVPPAAARYCWFGRRKTIATAPNPSPEQTENLGPVRSAKDSRLRSQQHCFFRDWEGMFAHGVRDSILIVSGRQPVLVFSCHPRLLSLVRVRGRQGYAVVVFACSQSSVLLLVGRKQCDSQLWGRVAGPKAPWD